MAEPFKLLLDARRVQAAAAALQAADQAKHNGFDAARFTALASLGLDALEFKARAMHIAKALEATLPAGFDAAAALIEAALAPPLPGDALNYGHTAPAGLHGWLVWPLGEFAVRRGMATPQRALALLHALTQRFSAEYAIRPFIVEHPALTFDTLAQWVHDPSPHVRRLASEGSRPRLPWGLRLQALVADPAPTLPLLAALQDDPSETVRRSVANHLNDIAKDHPGRVADWLALYLPGANAERRALLRHASRSLIKQGDARVLQAWGLGRPWRGSTALTLSPQRVDLGGHVELTLELCASGGAAQDLVVDYAVHHVKANGRLAPKVFKGWTLRLAPGQTCRLAKRHALRPITTRRYHAGEHGLDVRINGVVVAEGRFMLHLPDVQHPQPQHLPLLSHPSHGAADV